MGTEAVWLARQPLFLLTNALPLCIKYAIVKRMNIKILA